MTTKQLNSKTKTYYFYNDLIKLSNFSVNNLKLDKKTWNNIDIYYIGYIDKKKPEEWKVNSVSSLYLMINRVSCFVGEKNGIKYLSIDEGDALTTWNQVFSRIKYYIEKISGEKVNYDNGFDKIKFFSNDLLPLGKLIYFPTLHL